MTYLSRVILDTQRTSTRGILASRQRIHAVVMKTFSEEQNQQMQDAGGRTLWRLENEGKGVATLYIQTPEPPDLSRVKEAYGRPHDPESAVTKNYDAVITSVNLGDTYRFKFDANPIIRKRDQSIPLKKTDVPEWVISLLQRAGASVDADRLSVRQVQKETFNRGGKRITLHGAAISGLLTVVDSGVFRDSLEHGIGRGKGYGFGMLSVAKIAE